MVNSTKNSQLNSNPDLNAFNMDPRPSEIVLISRPTPFVPDAFSTPRDPSPSPADPAYRKYVKVDLGTAGNSLFDALRGWSVKRLIAHLSPSCFRSRRSTRLFDCRTAAVVTPISDAIKLVGCPRTVARQNESQVVVSNSARI